MPSPIKAGCPNPLFLPALPPWSPPRSRSVQERSQLRRHRCGGAAEQRRQGLREQTQHRDDGKLQCGDGVRGWRDGGMG